MADRKWFVYLLECVGGSIYTGIAVDVEARYRAHLEGRGARYTRSFPPTALLAVEAYPDRSSASRAEWSIKRLTPAQKRAYATALAARSATPAEESD